MYDTGGIEIGKSPEPKIAVNESSCVLPKGTRMSSDSVYDGRTLRLGYLETDTAGKKNTPEEQHDKADELARTLNSLGGETKLFDHEISGEDILALPKKVEDILHGKTGKMAGILINVLGNDHKPQESALVTIALLDYIIVHHSEPTETLLKGAVSQAEKVLTVSNGEKSFPERGLAISVINRNGEMGIAISRNAAVVVQKADGRPPFRLCDESWFSGDYGYKVLKGKTEKLQSHDKVILCAEDALVKMQTHKPVDEMVNELVAASSHEQRAHGAVGAEMNTTSQKKKGGSEAPDTTHSEGEGLAIAPTDSPDAALAKLAGKADTEEATTPELIVTEPEPPSAAETYGESTTPELVVTEPVESAPVKTPESVVAAPTDERPQTVSDTPEVATTAHKFPYYRDTGEKVSIEQFEKTHAEYVTVAQELVTIAKGIIVKNDGESDVHYNQRIMDAVVDRLKYPGDYETKDDALYTAVSTHPRVLERADLSLIGVEVQQALCAKGAQKTLREAEQNRLQEVARRKVRTIVRRDGEPAHITGEYDPFFDEAGKAKERPKKDLYAFGLIADQLLDVSDPTIQTTPGASRTYRELMRDLENVLNKPSEDPAASNSEKDVAARRLVSIRSQFYSYAMEAMRTIDQSQYINPDAATYSSKDTIISQMHATLRAARTKSIEQLINEYKGVSTGLSERNKAEMTRLLGKQQQLKMEYALKGGELMQRRISYEPESQVFSSTVRYKEFVEAPQSTQTEPVSRQPPVRIPPGHPKGKGAPPNGEPPQEPVIPEIVPTLEPAPITPRPPEPVRPPQSFIIANGVDAGQVQKDSRGGVDFQMQLQQRPLDNTGRRTGLWNGVKNLVSGVWQRSLLSSVFREREERWRRNVLARTGLTYLSNELVEQAFREGERRVGQRNVFRRLADRLVYNPLANTIGLNTTRHAEARGWLVEHVNQARAGDAQAAQSVRTLLSSSQESRESFGARLALENEAFAVHQGEQRQTVADPALRQALTQDFFELLTPYINGAINDEQARVVVDQYCSQQGVIRPDGSTLRLSDRIGNQNQAFASQLAVIGSNMRRVAEVMRINRQAYVDNGIVDNPQSVDSWMRAVNADGPQNRINITFYVANAEISQAGRTESLTEEVERRLLGRNPNRPAVMGNGAMLNAGNWVTKLAANLGLNEITVGSFGGYAGAWINTLIPINPSRATTIATVGGFSVPFMVIGTTVGAPVIVPILAGAAAAGIVSGYREYRRIRREHFSTEREASFNVLQPQNAQVNVGRLSGFFRGLYGSTSKQELQDRIVHQREAGVLLRGLTEGSGLFSEPTKLTSQLPENVSIDSVRVALRNLSEMRARINATGQLNRRFIRYNSQAGEAQQQEVLDGASQEVYQRLSRLFADRADVRDTFLQPQGVANFGELYNRLVDSYMHNLLGDPAPNPGQRALLDSLKASQAMTDQEIGLVREQENLRSRDRAIGSLATWRGVHRLAAVAGSSIIGGQVYAEAARHIIGTPPSLVGWAFGEGVFAPERPDLGNIIQFQDIHFRPPKTFLYDNVTHELRSSTGATLDLDSVVDPTTGGVDKARLAAELQKLNVVQEGIERVPYYTQPQKDVSFGNTIIRAPGEVGVIDQDNNGLVDTITIRGQQIKLSSELNPANRQDIESLAATLRAHNLDATISETTPVVPARPVEAPPPPIIDTIDRMNRDELFGQYGHKLAGREWYVNNTPVSDGNELRLYTFHENNAMVISIDKMGKSFQKGLVPEEIYVPTVVKEGKAVVAFSLPDHSREPITVIIPSNGRLVMDPTNSDPNYKFMLADGSGRTIQGGILSRQLLNVPELEKAEQGNIATQLTKRFSMWRLGSDGRMGTIEAATITHTNNGDVIKTFATIQGSGGEASVPPPPETPPPPPPQPPHYVLEATSQARDVANFGFKGYSEFAAGVVPIPFTSYSQSGRVQQQQTPNITPLPPIFQTPPQPGDQSPPGHLSQEEGQPGGPITLEQQRQELERRRREAEERLRQAQTDEEREAAQQELDQLDAELSQLPPEQPPPATGGTTPPVGPGPRQRPTNGENSFETTAVIEHVDPQTNVAERLESLEAFASRSQHESREVYEASLARVMEALRGTDGIVDLKKDVPTIVVPDLHARRDFLLNVMKQEINGIKVHDLLKQGKINVVCVGDGMHSEDPLNWTPAVYGKDRQLTEYGKVEKEVKAVWKAMFDADPANHGKHYGWMEQDDMEQRFKNSIDPAHVALRQRWYTLYSREFVRLLNEEMNRSLGLMKMVMDLKSAFPTSFHYLRGNHDDVMGRYRKFANESEDARRWILRMYGESFFQKWAAFEDALPVLVKGNGFVVSHAAPFGPFTEEDIRARKKDVVGVDSMIAEDGKLHHRGLIWTDNTQDDQLRFVEKAVPAVLHNLGLPAYTRWIIGHRQVDEPRRVRVQLGGKLIQINNPDKQFIGIIAENGNFNPDTDVVQIG